MTLTGPAEWRATTGRWHDGTGKPIDGPAPLAKLGVNGQYKDRRTGKIMTIARIETLESGHVVVVARG